MIIGIDGNDANVTERVGVSVYCAELLTHFQQWANAQQKIRVYLRDEPQEAMPPETPYYSYTVVKPRKLWSQIGLPLHLLFKRDCDVFFTPHHYAPRLCPMPLVITVHDLAYELFPDEFLPGDLYKLKHWTRSSVKKATHVIAVSEHTKKDLERMYHTSPSKISVIHNGFYAHASQVPPEKDKSTLTKLHLEPQNYILHVGTLQPRKNLIHLMRAVHAYRAHNNNIKLVLIGKKGWLYEPILREVEALEAQDWVIMPGYLAREDVSELYHNAFCYGLPSLYEGFGIPALEAMSMSCPVVASSTSSLPEVVGDAAILVDPGDITAWVHAFETLEQPETRRIIIAKGLKRIQEFSWEKAARETWHVLTHI